MPDPDGPECPPVDLRLFGHQRGQAPVDGGRRGRTNRSHEAPQLHNRSGVATRAHHLEEPRGSEPRILCERVADEREVRIEAAGAARATSDGVRVVRDGGAHGVMVDGEGRGDGADLPVLAEIKPANLGVLLGRDHAGSPGTRDGRASAVEGARRFPGRRPCIATRPPGVRSAQDPSSCPRAVWRASPSGGKSDPSRGRDTPAGGHDDRAVPPGSVGVAVGPPGAIADAPDHDTPTSNRPGLDRRTGKWQTDDCRGDRSSGGEACPRRRSGGALRLDTAVNSVAQEDDQLGRRRSIEVVTEGLEASTPGPHLVRRRASVRECGVSGKPPRAMDADAPVDAQTAPTAAWKSRCRTRDSHKRPQPISSVCSFRKRSRPDGQRSRFTRFQVSADTCGGRIQ